ncbi:hypothetical protein [Micromonospora tulbaghiae]|uniref:hypothetical protein n=1 Tax=Micromonospora tulbaghiae TaxID=479978 RepID=UPI0033DE89B3
MTVGEWRAGAALYGRPRRRPVVLEPVPTVCEACGTDLDTSPNCPANCPTPKRR